MNGNMKHLKRRAAAFTRRGALRALAGSAIAVSVAGAAPASAAEQNVQNVQPTHVAMLVQLGGPNLKVDERIGAHLQTRGYAVRFVDQAATPDAARDADLVIISSTVSSKN